MPSPPPDLGRLKALFALTKLSTPLRSDVLHDGRIAERFDLDTAHPVNLRPDVVLRRDELFTAFQHAADGEPSWPLTNELGGTVEPSVSIASDGAGLVTIGTDGWRFEHAALLSAKRERRHSELRECLAQHTLTSRDRDCLCEHVARPEFSTDDFIAVVTILASSPESFGRRLRARLETKQIGKANLVPDDVRHWEHLTAPLGRATNLTEFITHELADEWKARLSADSKHAFRSITLTFASPTLVPRSLFDTIDTGSIVQLLESACGFDDPFALTGAFQICADRLADDIQFIGLGDRLLDQLLGDMDRLETACQIFAAAFVVSTAWLAEHEALRDRPPFWRRLAAASHASLVVRSCGVTKVKQDKLLQWAMNVAGESYVLSILNDFSVEPRWRPEWIADHFLLADVYGRVLSTLQSIPESHRPDSWQARLNAVTPWIQERHLDVLAHFPAVMEGSRRPVGVSFVELGPLADLYRKLGEHPTPRQFLMLSPVIHTFGLPLEACDDVFKIINGVRSEAGTLDDMELQKTLLLAAHVAVQSNDLTLADAIAETCLEKARLVKERHSATEVVHRLVECATANSDRTAARQILAHRLESLAFILSTPDMLGDLVDLLESLKQIDPHIAMLLGRAVATARLGKYRSLAA